MNFKVTESEAAIVIESACKRGARPITVTLRSSRKLMQKSRKDASPPPFPVVNKVTTLNGIANFDYTKAVNRRLKKEGAPENFVAKQAFYHFSYKGNPAKAIVTSKTDPESVYIRIKPESVVSTTLTSPNDDIVDFKAVEDYLPKTNGDSLDKATACVTIALRNVVSFVMDSNFYEIRR